MGMSRYEVVDAGEVLIVGAGLAGLFTALKLNRPVTIVTASALGAGASSAWAQGGIAAALGADDRPELHAADTIAAGAGIVDPMIARLMADEAAARIADLAGIGVAFDRDSSGQFVLGREAAHCRRRIVRVKGDKAGWAIMEALVAAVRKAPHITVLEGYRAFELIVIDGRACGVWAVGGAKLGQINAIRADNVIFALGGAGGLYAVTTNPPQSAGHGLAMAARAGASIADPEFVQFHPTALDVGRDPAPLATEALRGEGAILVNDRGERFMSAIHPQAELAPRDIVARGIFREIQAGRRVFLDARTAVGARFPELFPTVTKACIEAGIDPVTQSIPVAPAAHYHMGGIATDAHGRTSLARLWACGECASTGAHGANRLASNSLLEAIVFGARVAADVAASIRPREIGLLPEPPVAPGKPGDALALRRIMTEFVGLERNGAGLGKALLRIEQIRHAARQAHDAGLGNMATAALLIAAAAYQRSESRGSHYRSDFPKAEKVWERRTFITLREAEKIARRAIAATRPLDAGGVRYDLRPQP
jgi:L-aspartate oxidase